MRDIFISLVGGTVAGAIALVGNYAITYATIERPKIALEALKQAQLLTPAASTNCFSARDDKWTWRIECSTTSTSTYPILVEVGEAVIHIAGDRKETDYEQGKSFTVMHPKQKKGYKALPGSKGSLWFYIEFSKAEFPDGVARKDLVAWVNFRYSALDTTRDHVATVYPDIKPVLDDVTSSGETLLIDLPPEAPVAAPA